MNGMFDTLEDYLPACLLILVWLVVLPIRVLALLFLPIGAARSSHRLHKVQQFLAL